MACLTALMGVWFLAGGSLDGFTKGDWYVLAGAIFFAIHMVLLGEVVGRIKAPLVIVCLQYFVVGVVAFIGAIIFEHVTFEALFANIWPLVYAGIFSGGIAFTFQAVAQQHTPPAEAAVIFSTEALFAALAGAILLGDRLDWLGWAGCALIILATLMVEVWPAMYDKYKFKRLLKR